MEASTRDRRPKILIVEDDRDIREVLADALDAEGYRCATAVDGGEAIGWLTSYRRPAIILLDVLMPAFDGFAFRQAQLADSRLAAIPVVVITADIGRVVERMRDMPVLQKPFELSELLAVIESKLAFAEQRWGDEELPTWPRSVLPPA